MEILTKILQLILALSILVIIHEFGHFMFARIFKCRVEKFYLFFDPWFSLFKKKIGDTEYGIGWLPLGGYCKISGMVDESMDKEQMAEPAKPWEYRSKPAWQRLLIIIGGVMMNFLLAIIIYIGITFTWGDRYVKTSDVKDGFAYSVQAQELGFRNGDKIISVDGQPVESYTQIQSAIILSDRREVVVDRAGEKLTITVPDESVKTILNTPGLVTLRIPFVISEVDATGSAKRAGLVAGDSLVAIDSVQMVYFDQYQESFANHSGDTVQMTFVRSGQQITTPITISEDAKIGVAVQADLSRSYKVSTADYTLMQAIPKGFERGISQVDNYWKQLKLIASPETEAYKSVGGFITMGKIFPGEWSWFAFWNITALLSIMLAVLNILPIPALDGGHMVFIIYEMITRRAPSDKFMEVAQYVGFGLLFALLIFANGSDVMRLFK